LLDGYTIKFEPTYSYFSTPLTLLLKPFIRTPTLFNQLRLLVGGFLQVLFSDLIILLVEFLIPFVVNDRIGTIEFGFALTNICLPSFGFYGKSILFTSTIFTG
jgi:hypothetical protein